MGTKMNITDLGSSIFDNIEQQDSGDFLRHLLECRAGNWKNVEDNKRAHCGNYLKHQSLIQDTGREFVFSLSLLDSANRKINNFNLITASQTELRFENKRYSLSSAIFHHGNVQYLMKDTIHQF